MALQWVILTYVVAAEAALALILTLPAPTVIRSQIVSLVSLTLQPATGILPFSVFQLMDIYWKAEHRLMCASDVCTEAERARYEKSVHLSYLQVSQGNQGTRRAGEASQESVDCYETGS